MRILGSMKSMYHSFWMGFKFCHFVGADRGSGMPGRARRAGVS